MTRTTLTLTSGAAMFALTLASAMSTTATTASAQTPTPPPTPSSVEQVRLAWVYDSATTMTVRWRGDLAGGRARVRSVGSEVWNEVQASELPIGSDAGRHFEVTFIELSPATQYEYQVADQADWTASYQFRTTSTAGLPVTAAFVADTGIPGRLDGLTTGTADVLRAIDELDPTVVLGGGDYAYFDSDPRYATQSAAMDAWLRSMESVTSERPFMPTYGNHEVLLQERVDDWVARFATPDGDVGRTSYSFDVDGVHFVALLAYESIISPETFAWLAADLEAAKQRGVRKIVPYLHRNVYGDGTVHDPSPSLARQLTALFELHDIDVVLTAHDQSYERTFPLSQGEPTTNSRRCYTGAEGITWVKTSPGGKLSSISLGFSQYSATPPSAQVAVRENALHHFSTVTVTGSDLEVVTYGVVGDGSPAVVVDRFQYQESCAPELSFTGLPAIVDVAEQSAQTFGVTVSVADPAMAWSTDVPWLSIAADSQPGSALVSLDSAQLAVGTHVSSVRAELAGYDPTTLLVVARVGTPLPAGELVSFSGTDRSSNVTLDGAVVAGSAYLGFIPDVPVLSVAFMLDGTALRMEETDPFDVAGGDDAAVPLELEVGPHTLEAVLTAPSGATDTLIANFTVGDPSVASTCVAEPCPSVPPTLPVAGAPPASAATSPAAPTSGGLSTLAPPVDRTNSSSSSTTGDDWWSSWPTLLLAVVVVGLFVGLITRPRSQRAESAGAS